MSPDYAHWFAGRLSGVERVLSAAGPALFLILYFGIAGLIYSARRWWRGPFRDEEMDQRVMGGLGSRGLRHFFAWTMRPWWRVLARVGFPPNAITSLSFAVAFGTLPATLNASPLWTNNVASPPSSRIMFGPWPSGQRSI